MTTTPTTTLSPIDADDYQAPVDVRDQNAKRFGSMHTDECFLCGRGLTEGAVERGKMVHLRTDGFLLPAGEAFDNDPESQGWFPVGSECAKRLPAGYAVRPSF